MAGYRLMLSSSATRPGHLVFLIIADAAQAGSC
jgi:hypothetical protein